MTYREPLLPDAYIKQMTDLLGPEAASFLHSYNEPRTYGLRLNGRKADEYAPGQDRLLPMFGLTPVPWCRSGYYYEEDSRPGRHPYHAAGLYYIQEPSAMSAAELLAAQPGETVLDLAAAPGGKTTQIAAMMAGSGLLVANEIHPARAKILSENVERMGIANAVVTNAAPDVLASRFPGFFDAVMLDAPCSGEGMFRKDPDAVTEWSEAHVAMCAARQADILDQAALMVKPGGRLVYSTCTFNRQENEETIEAFVERFPSFELIRTERIYPNRDRGEGHFVALLHHHGGTGESTDITGHAGAVPRPLERRKSGRGAAGSSAAADLALFHAFTAEALPGLQPLPQGEPLKFGEQLYWLPHDAEGRFGAAALGGLRVIRPGLHLGELRKGRFEPAHALARFASASAARWTQSYSPDAVEIAAYLRGETIPAAPEAGGWGLVAVDGLPLGWGKASGGQVKNRLPKGLRRP